jgi:HEAT repeat protein
MKNQPNEEADEKQPSHEEPSPEHATGAVDATDQLADRLAMEPANPQSEAVVAETTEVVLEEERVKDEIEIQIDLLRDPDWAVRREACITLGEMGDERCVEPLVLALRDGDWQVREAAMEALGVVGSPAVEHVIKMLRDWDIRKAAIRTLGKIRDERVLDPLIGQLRADEFHLDAMEALVELGQPAVEKLLPLLKDKEEALRKRAVIVLGRIKDSGVLEPLIEMLHDPDWFTRLSAAAALEQIGDARGREAIKPLLKDPDLVVRMRVERILAGWKKKQEATA